MAFEAGVNAFEIGHPSPAMMNGVGEVFARLERRLDVISWRTTLTDGAFGVIQQARDLCAALGLASLDLIILALEGPLRDPGLLGDLR